MNRKVYIINGNKVSKCGKRNNPDRVPDKFSKYTEVVKTEKKSLKNVEDEQTTEFPFEDIEQENKTSKFF